MPTLPAWRTRREQFDQLVKNTVARIAQTYPEISSIEYGVEEVPPSTPAPWEEHDISLARLFPRDRIRGLNDRIVLYRQPILHRCDPEELPDFLALLLAERISHVLKLDPEDLLF